MRILDGNHLSATEHRLEPLRIIWDAPLPGRALVVMEQETGLSTDVFLTPDGHANERTLLDDVLQTVRERDVWMADRNFCTLKFLFQIARKSAFFIIRQHGTVKGVLKGRRRFVGEGTTGKVHEQAIELTFEGETRTFRRLSVELREPTRDGDSHGRSEDKMEAQLVETWNIHDRINRYLLDAVSAESPGVAMTPKFRTVSPLFAHIHNVRRLWLKPAAPELLDGLAKLV